MFLTLAGIGCAKKEEPPTAATQQEGVEQEISTFKLAGYAEGGKKKWEIEGESADVLTDFVKLNNIIAKAYGEEVPVTLTADSGMIDKKTNNVHLEKNVVINTKGGAKLLTDNLDWKAQKEEVHTDADVIVQNNNMETTGKGMTGETQLQKVKLLENVTVKIQPATVITCTGSLEVDYNNNVAVFNDNVKIEDQRGKLTADQMTVYFDQKNQKLKKVVAKGNVKIMRGDNSSFCQEATYFADENRVVLTGQPKIEIFTKEELVK